VLEFFQCFLARKIDHDTIKQIISRTIVNTHRIASPMAVKKTKLHCAELAGNDSGCSNWFQSWQSFVELFETMPTTARILSRDR
jgi:hypothetical protein